MKQKLTSKVLDLFKYYNFGLDHFLSDVIWEIKR
jgi:hypothetical protein